jgi:hypothetical protein
MRIAAFVILGAAAIGSPAAAQSWTGINTESHAAAPHGTDVYRQTDRIDRSIRAGRKSGQLTRAEAHRLRRQAALIDAMADRYAADGISVGEAGELDTRANVLSQQVFYDRLTTSAAVSHN